MYVKIACAALLSVILRPELESKQAIEWGNRACREIEKIIQDTAIVDCIEPGEEFQVDVPSNILDAICKSLRAQGERHRANSIELTCRSYSERMECDCVLFTASSLRKLIRDVRR